MCNHLMGTAPVLASARRCQWRPEEASSESIYNKLSVNGPSWPCPSSQTSMCQPAQTIHSHIRPLSGYILGPDPCPLPKLCSKCRCSRLGRPVSKGGSLQRWEWYCYSGVPPFRRAEPRETAGGVRFGCHICRMDFESRDRGSN